MQKVTSLLYAIVLLLVVLGMCYVVVEGNSTLWNFSQIVISIWIWIEVHEIQKDLKNIYKCVDNENETW